MLAALSAEYWAVSRVASLADVLVGAWGVESVDEWADLKVGE